MSGGRVLISLGAIGKDLPPLTHNMLLRVLFDKSPINAPWRAAGAKGYIRTSRAEKAAHRL